MRRNTLRGKDAAVNIIQRLWRGYSGFLDRVTDRVANALWPGGSLYDRWFGEPPSDDDPGGQGGTKVREPRRPRPGSGQGAMGIHLLDETEGEGQVASVPVRHTTEGRVEQAG